MARTQQYIRSLAKVLEGYKGEGPFSRYLGQYFKEHRNMGSKDRRMVSRYAYHYFRLGGAGAGMDLETKLLWAEFLCTEESELVGIQKPEWLPFLTEDFSAKLDFLQSHTSFLLSDVFPFKDKLSLSLDSDLYIKQFFIQPDLFLRIRKGKNREVLRLLTSAAIPFEKIGPQTLALPNGAGVDRIPALRGLVEVQDFSSQQTLENISALPGESWWDACSGSGGKSLLMMDQHPNIKLLVSDKRASVLKNLDLRFEAAGLANYRRKIIDLTKDTSPVLGDETFDGIILDAPCSGSGTWGRTPEMLQHFDTAAIADYAALQKTIAKQVIRHLKDDRPLVYITCSVFAEENEEIVKFLLAEFPLKLQSMRYLKGYESKSDTLFVANLLKANS